MSKLALSLPAVVFVDIDASPACSLDRVDRLAALLETLATTRTTLVFCSHRTRAEVEGIRQSLGVFHPFVCENGAAAFVPAGYFGADPANARPVAGYQAIEFGSSYDCVVETVRRAAARLAVGIVGFSTMSVDRVARECGCSLLDARLAKLRDYGEPFRLEPPDPAAERRLLKALDSAGLTCVRRGGFHYAGTAPGPRAAIAALTTLYRMALGSIMTAHFLQAAWVEGPPPRTQVEWLERIAQAVDSLRRERQTAPEVQAGRLASVGRDVVSGRLTSKSP